MLNNNDNLLMGGTGFENQSVRYEDDLLISQNPLQSLIDNIVWSSTKFMSGSELAKLNKVLFEVLEKFEVIFEEDKESDENFQEKTENLLQKYIHTATLEGKSQRTITYYEDSFRKFIEFCFKPINDITTNDVRDYLSFKKKNDNVSNTTLDNIRRALSAVFGWLNDEGYIMRNPVSSISKIKDKSKVKKPFTPQEIELLRIQLSKSKNNLRDLAIFELLLSSGIRIGELVRLNIRDVDLKDCSMVVTGKGNKQREAYFNVKTQTCLELYLKSRTDNNPALFVSSKAPYNRFGINGIERMIRETGKKAGVPKTHPHKFRRSFATTLLSKGVPIEQVKTLLGHSNLDTTTIYAMVDEEQLNWNHKKLLD